jgi:ribosomal protein L21
MPIRRATAPLSMTYAIVKFGGKQYRVQEGEYLLVDRLAVGENEAFHPEVLFVGGDGQAELSPKGYRRHNGFRASLSRVQIESIGKKATRSAAAKPAATEEKPKTAPKAEAAAPAKKPAARRTTTKKAE